MVGNCTVAGFYHMLMTQRSVAQAGNPLVVTTEQALADYSAITGYDPTTGANDNGAYCSDVLAFYLAKGRILGKASVDFHNVDMVKAVIISVACTVDSPSHSPQLMNFNRTLTLPSNSFPMTEPAQKVIALMM